MIERVHRDHYSQGSVMGVFNISIDRGSLSTSIPMEVVAFAESFGILEWLMCRNKELEIGG